MDKLHKYLPVAVLTAATMFFAYDIIVDLVFDEDGYLHIVVEFAVFLAISSVLYRELLHVKALDKEVRQEKSKNARLAGELLLVMQVQFKQWNLSSSEREIALFLIKGLSMKEIAGLRNVKEKTVRLQATNIYSKSGHAGRHELAAHFIADLMSGA